MPPPPISKVRQPPEDCRLSAGGSPHRTRLGSASGEDSDSQGSDDKADEKNNEESDDESLSTCDSSHGHSHSHTDNNNNSGELVQGNNRNVLHCTSLNAPAYAMVRSEYTGKFTEVKALLWEQKESLIRSFLITSLDPGWKDRGDRIVHVFWNWTPYVAPQCTTPFVGFFWQFRVVDDDPSDETGIGIFIGKGARYLSVYQLVPEHPQIPSASTTGNSYHRVTLMCRVLLVALAVVGLHTVWSWWGPK